MIEKITFELTVGSYLPEIIEPYNIHVDGPILPIGGEIVNKTISFETDGKDAWADALKALDKKMGRDDYHIWYWWWRKNDLNPEHVNCRCGLIPISLGEE